MYILTPHKRFSTLSWEDTTGLPEPFYPADIGKFEKGYICLEQDQWYITKYYTLNGIDFLRTSIAGDYSTIDNHIFCINAETINDVQNSKLSISTNGVDWETIYIPVCKNATFGPSPTSMIKSDNCYSYLCKVQFYPDTDIEGLYRSIIYKIYSTDLKNWNCEKIKEYTSTDRRLMSIYLVGGLNGIYSYLLVFEEGEVSKSIYHTWGMTYTYSEGLKIANTYFTENFKGTARYGYFTTKYNNYLFFSNTGPIYISNDGLNYTEVIDETTEMIYTGYLNHLTNNLVYKNYIIKEYYDDEKDAVFFTIYDLITLKVIKTITKKEFYDIYSTCFIINDYLYCRHAYPSENQIKIRRVNIHDLLDI